MEGAVILKAGGLLVFGALFIWLGILGWKHRSEDRISVIEAVLLGDEEPLPFSRIDRALAYIQPFLFLFMGPMMVLGGVAIIATTGETQ